MEAKSLLSPRYRRQALVLIPVLALLVSAGGPALAEVQTHDRQIGVARYNVNGSPDTTFASDGLVVTDFSNSTSELAHAVLIDNSSRIVVAGSAEVNGSYVFALARYLNNGSLDTSFGGDGRVLTDFANSTDEEAYAVAINRSNGKIIAGGYATVNGGKQFALARYNNNGTLDVSFDGDGLVLGDFSGSTDEFLDALTLDRNGRIVTAGYATVDGGDQFILARFNSNGSFDTTFDLDGKLATDFPTSTSEVAYTVTIDRNNQIVAAGYATVSGFLQFALARYHTDGSLDTAFGGDGRVVTDVPGSTEDFIRAIAVDGQNRYVVAGHAADTFAFARYYGNGTLDTAFDGDGIAFADFLSSSEEIAYAVALPGSGKIVAAGSVIMDGVKHFGVARLNSNGSPDTSFDLDGKTTSEFPNSGEEIPFGVAVQNGKIVAAGCAAISGTC